MSDLGLRALLWLAGRLPLKQRLALVSFIVRRVLAPALRWPARIEANLDYVRPDMPPSERTALIDASLDNLARVFIENYDVPALHRRGAACPLTGPGLDAVEQARAEGRPVLFVTGHYGNPEAARAAMQMRGWSVGGLYRPMANPYFNAHYKENFHAVSGDVFEQGRRGTLGLLKHMRGGGMAVLLFDVYDSAGVPIPFLGQPAPTLTSAADIALRSNALMVPFFGIRHSDGITMTNVLETPIQHGDPKQMMEEATRRLEARIAEDPGQWMWVHRRWKPKRQARLQRKRAAAKMGP
jgi:KDO2-lipid IV(A) lauroyltransferase